MPNLPGSDKPNIKKYNEFILNSGWEFNEETVIIGHSSGAVAILGLLPKLPARVDTCILVSAFKNNLRWKELDGLFEKPFNFEDIRNKSKQFILIHSDNDPYCPLEHAEYLTRKLGAKLVVKKGQGHFNLEQGEQYKKFPLILEMVENG